MQPPEMMEKYLLTVLVTLEQESAIRYLFTQQGWEFLKLGESEQTAEEEGPVHVECPLPGNNTLVIKQESQEREESAFTKIVPRPKAVELSHQDSTDKGTEIKEEKVDYNMDCDTDVDEFYSEESQDNCLNTLIFKKVKAEKPKGKKPKQLKKSPQKTKSKSDVLGKHTCFDCNKQFSSESNLKVHKARNNGKCFLNCEYCGKKFIKPSKMNIHIRGVHKKEFADKLRTKGHNTKSKDILKTENDEYNMDTDTDVDDNLRLEGDANDIQNTNHSSDLHNGSMTKTPRVKKERPKLYTCSECARSFTSENNLLAHKAKNNGLCYFTCEYCQKKFYKRSKMNTHIQTIHTKNLPFICEICGRGAVSAEKLKVHMRIHTGEKPCICEQCGRGYRSLGELTTHRKYQHIWKENDVKFMCKICNTDYRSKPYLAYHMKVTHAEGREHKCSLCEKSFKASDHLRYHMKFTHSERPQYQCKECDKAFKAPAALRKHALQHKAHREKTFFCSMCDKSFFEKVRLKQHEYVHLGLKPYKCNFCSYSCAFNGNLCKHKKSVHPLEWKAAKEEKKDVSSAQKNSKSKTLDNGQEDEVASGEASNDDDKKEMSVNNHLDSDVSMPVN
ncbi:zinc finger protein 235-like [Dreissena polymorpha]|uniref:C2H2-type domain-containing protein n=1 Tax=Dreissena polymorpha TaxID=45954 RepID=A0A9D4BSD8_DREPO|nr:zinc finger protein 235-like [Dreissena polymorpha]XP_052251469.1 zinc finger protein 235-like [Dreissena polymorpha]KAH3706474.1 hypothetical protein DPMN_065860 [Dreissena polymorpha]